MESNSDEGHITEEILKQRLKHAESGALGPQILMTIAVCFGSFSFGNIIGWGGPALTHLKELEYTEYKPNKDFAWVVSLAPLAAACGILPCAFITKRMGPKKTMLFQTPFLLLGWFLMAYYNSYKIYCSAHFVCAFFAVCYVYSGQIFLIETVSRKYMKTFYACFRSSVILGILSMNIISTFFARIWMCTICASMAVICFILTFILPDSPVFLIQKSELKAEESLKFYTGKTAVGPELNVIRQYVKFLNFGSQSNKHMLSKKVVIRAILIVTALQVVRTLTGYYAFVLDSVRIFSQTASLFTPYVDNIIFGVVLCVARFIGTMVHLHCDLGVKKPMMASTCLMTIILISLGCISFIDKNMEFENQKWIMLIGLGLFAVAYELGMDLCPEIILYEYTPYQVYDFLMKLMMVVHWFLVFLVLRSYMGCQIDFGLHVAMWILAATALVGFIFIAICVVETKGKSLVAIQMELGGNPVGNRGSRRQRIANPFEAYHDVNQLRQLIIEHQDAVGTSTSTEK